MALILSVTAAVAWFIFSRLARDQDITVGQAIQNTVRRDLDKAKLTPGRINFAYRALMRGTGVVGPAGQVIPVAAIEVRMPEEDYLFVRELGGKEFAGQLSKYRHTYAIKQGWSQSDEPAATVGLVIDPALKRLRPSSINYYRDRIGFTKVWTNDEGVTKTTDRTKTTATEVLETGTVSYKSARWALDVTRVYRLGRTPDNDIQIDHPEVSSRHANIAFDADCWVLTPTGAKNKTRVDGTVIDGPTRLSSGASITIGASEPIGFELENTSSVRTAEL